MDARKHNALRACIDKLVQQGWSISGRDPVRLERGSRISIVRNGKLIND